MTTYVGSSALVPLYVPEPFSPAARAVARAVGQVPFTALHRLEVSNAFELLVGRNVMTRDQGRAVHAQLRDDIDARRLLEIAVDLKEVFGPACALSQEHTATLLTRSPDLLHVAAAHRAGCTTFVSARRPSARSCRGIGAGADRRQAP